MRVNHLRHFVTIAILFISITSVRAANDLYPLRLYSDLTRGRWVPGVGNPPPSPPISFSVALTSDPVALEPRVGFTISNIVPIPYPGGEIWWTITEANADEFDLDWSAIEGAMTNNAFRWIVESTGDYFRSGRVDWQSDNLELDAIDLESIEVFTSWNWEGAHPSFTVGAFSGQGHFIPEPSSVVMLFIGLAAGLRIRYRSHKRN